MNAAIKQAIETKKLICLLITSENVAVVFQVIILYNFFHHFNILIASGKYKVPYNHYLI